MFIDASHARTSTSEHITRLASGASYDQRHHDQYLPARVGASGCFSIASTPHETPPSNEISTRMTLRPPPE